MVFVERFHYTWKNFSPSSCSLRCWSAARFWNLEAKWISWAEVFSLRTLYFCWACVYRRCSWSWKNWYVTKKSLIRCYFFHSQLIHWQTLKTESWRYQVWWQIHLRVPGDCFTNVLRALQNNLVKIYNVRDHTSDENFKLKLCMCAQSHALGTRTNFQLEIGQSYKF